MVVGLHRSGPSYVVLLAGDHLELGHGEISALESLEFGEERAAFALHRVRTTPSEYAASHAAQALEWGDYWTSVRSRDDAARILSRAAKSQTTGEGSIAVRVTRFDNAPKHLTQEMAVEIGAALKAAGHTIDLQTPDHEVFVWLSPKEAVMGLLRGSNRGQHATRAMEERSHFSPIGMHPRRAASLIHLARVPRGGRILDPFCGTGGIVLEAALEGYDAWGSDLDPWMVQGTLQTLTDAAEQPLEGTVFQADIGDVPNLVEGIDGIVTDMPYGKASSTDREGLATLYDRALEAFADILPPGGLAVIGHMDPQLLANAPHHGLDAVQRNYGFRSAPEVYHEYVHGSMTRHYAVLRRS